MTALAKIKEEYNTDSVDQVAAIRLDVERLRDDVLALRDDLVNNEAALQRRKRRPGSEVWAESLTVDEPKNGELPNILQEKQQHKFAAVAIAGAFVIAASLFAVWSSRDTASG